MENDEDFLDGFEFTKHELKRYNLSPEVADDTEVHIEPESKMLDPNHPLLARFQQALKEYLTKQITRLKEDVFELDTEVKKKNQAREQLGIEAYETQQLVIKQQKEIDTCLSDLETLTAAREQLEDDLEKSNQLHKDTKNQLNESEKKEIELRNELESTDLWLQQMKKWEEEVESELMVNQRMADKTKKERVRLATEKKQQDMLIYNLSNEVWRLELELETILMQLRVKEEEREKYAETVMLSNMDIEANEAEHKCLMHGWQSIISTISARDKHYNSLMATVRNMSEEVTSIKSEIGQVKKLCNKEHTKNESLTLFKEQVVTDKKNSFRLLNNELDKRDNYEKCMLEYESIVARLNEDIKRVQTETAAISQAYITITRDWEKLTYEKVSLEEKIFESLQEKIDSDKTASHYVKIIKASKEENREYKIRLSKLENNNAKTVKDRELQLLENEELERIDGELQRQMKQEDGQLLQTIRDLERCTDEQVRNMRNYQTLQLKLKNILESSSGSAINPLESRIKYLEGMINDTQDKNKEMETYWLREQAIIVDFSEKRQAQIKDMNLLKKQILILDQKNLKVNDDINGYKTQEDNLTREINTLQSRLATFTDMLDRKRESTESLDGSNNFTQIELLMKLEDAEFESLKLKAEISDIGEDKVSLSNELIERNREALCWEKKIQMAVEAKKNIAKEQSEEGEIGQMKAEIHRMNVRYSQLKKAQDKLMQDFEHCISRRETIVNIAEARVQHVKGGFQKMRVNFNKKTDDLKNKIKQLDNEDENLEKRVEMRQYEIDRTEEEICAAVDDIRSIKELCQQKGDEIEKRRIDKQLNLDILLFKQRKLKIYAELARGRQPYTIYKTEAAAHVAYNREKELNQKLRTIIENLMIDFPNHNYALTKFHNTLVLPSIHL